MTDSTRKSLRLIVFGSLILILLVAAVTAGVWSLLNTPDKQPGRAPGSGGDFTLMSGAGPVSLHDFRGKVVLLFFGYTHCPDICPATLQHVGQALDLLESAEQERVRTLFITVDPERDTPAHLAGYVRFFHDGIIGLGGSLADIRQVARQYGVEFFHEKNDSGGDYQVVHTSYLFLLDASGAVVDRMSHRTSPQDIATALKRWLNPATSS
ncbi:MAG: SCO family protein [Mariprofundaceae bacterium]|nr:SCO family protein [Mariprofundaceae bacterium]